MILVIAVIRVLARGRLPRKMFLALWGLALARLLLPFSLPSKLSVYALLRMLLPAGAGRAAAQRVRLTVPLQAAAGAGAAKLSPWTWIWLIGCAVAAILAAVAYALCRRAIRAAKPVQSEFVSGWLRAHPLRRTVTVRQTDRFSTPLTCGVLRPAILLPERTDWQDTGTLQYVLTHEYVHIRRFDGAAKLLFLAAVCVHWFNPLVWVLYVFANRDLELACDETVVRLCGEDARGEYARALIRMEEARGGFAPLCSHFSQNPLEERIRAIMNIRKITVCSILIACLLVAGTATAFATSAPQETAGVETEVSNVTILSRVDEEDGKTYYSLDEGKTYISQEEFDRRCAVPNIEWWTYEDYKAWLENEKQELPKMIGEKGYTHAEDGREEEFVWTQQMVDEAIAQYERVLESIGNGARVSKTVDGQDDIMLMFTPDELGGFDEAEDIVTFRVMEP